MPVCVGNLIFKCGVKVTALRRFRVGLPRIILYDDGVLMTSNLITWWACLGVVPKYTGSLAIPALETALCPKPYNGDSCRHSSKMIPCSTRRSHVCLKHMSTDEPLSTNILLTSLTAISKLTTKASVWFGSKPS